MMNVSIKFRHTLNLVLILLKILLLDDYRQLLLNNSPEILIKLSTTVQSVWILWIVWRVNELSLDSPFNIVKLLLRVIGMRVVGLDFYIFYILDHSLRLHLIPLR